MSCPLLALRLERTDWMAQAEQLKQQTLATLSDRDQQLRQLSAMLEEARARTPKLQPEHYQREVGRVLLPFIQLHDFTRDCIWPLLLLLTPYAAPHCHTVGLGGGGQCSRSPPGEEPAGQPRFRR